MKEIKVTGTVAVAIIDDEDYPLISQYSWCLNNTRSTIQAYYEYAGNARGKVTSMASLIMGDVNQLIDHKDTNPFNNQKSNLRKATHQQNCFNKSKSVGCSSQYKGVYWFKRTQKWCARLFKDGKAHCLGYFKYEADAAIAYNIKAKEMFGEFANLNIVYYE